MPAELPGNGFLGWLGRQIGYVKRAVTKDVTREKVYENRTVEEASLPQDPNVKLRRTTIDEVIVLKKGETRDER